MQHPHPVPLRRRPRRISRRALVLLRRRRLPKRRSLFQLVTRGRGIRSSNRQQEVVTSRGGGDGKEEMEMEVVNMKLFWENRWIMEENQRLRKRALALRHENQILLTQLHHHHHDPKFVVVVHDINSNSTEDAGDDIASADGQLPAHQHPHQHHGHPGNPWKL